ncbi:MAG: class I SAM-dependent methyltransferase [Chromatiales bacterium]
MPLTTIMSDDDIRALKWYYEVELRQGVFTRGSRFINMLPTRKLLERIRLFGLKVLDIGTMEGAFSVMASRAGANVVAYDRLMLGDRVATVKESYDADFDYRAGDPFHIFAEKFRSSGEANFDCVLLSGVLYHTIEPSVFLYNARSLLRNGGILVFETACAISNDAALYFNERGRFFKFTNYYQPSTAWLDYFLRIIGFQIIDVEYVDPVQPEFDGKRISRVAMTCVLSDDSILEADDEWAAQRLSLKELAEFAPIRKDAPVDLSSRLSPDRYAPGLYYRDTPKRTLRLTDVVTTKTKLVRDQAKCVLRLDDRLY